MIEANALNEYGTPVTALTCVHCGHDFTVCPPVDPEKWGRECLGDACPSYDISRDIDMFWDTAMSGGLIERDHVIPPGTEGGDRS